MTPRMQLFVGAVVLTALGGAAGSASARCVEYETGIATGKIKKAFEYVTGEWWIIIADRENNPCRVQDVYSQIEIPASCIAGATVTAEGPLEENEGGELEISKATSVSCD